MKRLDVVLVDQGMDWVGHLLAYTRARQEIFQRNEYLSNVAREAAEMWPAPRWVAVLDEYNEVARRGWPKFSGAFAEAAKEVGKALAADEAARSLLQARPHRPSSLWVPRFFIVRDFRDMYDLLQMELLFDSGNRYRATGEAQRSGQIGPCYVVGSDEPFPATRRQVLTPIFEESFKQVYYGERVQVELDFNTLELAA